LNCRFIGHSSRLSISSKDTLRALFGRLSDREKLRLSKKVDRSSKVSCILRIRVDQKVHGLINFSEFFGELKLINHQIEFAGSERQFWCSKGCW
jgi:hypothetical protein